MTNKADSQISIHITNPLFTGSLDHCKYCGTNTKNCYENCQCLKCIKNKSYEIWKENEPDEYEYWLEKSGIINHTVEQMLKEFAQPDDEYWSRQIRILNKLNTSPKDWFPFYPRELKDIVFESKNIPEGYDLKTLFSKSFFIPVNLTYVEPLDINNKDDGIIYCQLCGQKIKKFEFIRNNKKSIYLFIGGVCRKKFKKEQRLYKELRKICRKLIRNDFKLLKPKLEVECWNPIFYSSRFKRKNGKPMPMQPYLDFYNKLKKINNVDKTKTTRILELIKESKDLGMRTTLDN